MEWWVRLTGRRGEIRDIVTNDDAVQRQKALATFNEQQARFFKQESINLAQLLTAIASQYPALRVGRIHVDWLRPGCRFRVADDPTTLDYILLPCGCMRCAANNSQPPPAPPAAGKETR